MKEIINKIKNKKKKKGFTLVELLAVIVILAVIMILTIPAVLNNVGEAKKKSFETVGKTLIKYIDDNYQNCKLGNKDIAKYDESLFDPNTCNLKNDIKEGNSKDWISNAGYNKEDISEVKVSINPEGKVDITVKPSNTGEYKDSEGFTTIALNYDPNCWNYSGSTINGFNGLDADENIDEKCNGFISKDSEGLYHLDIPEKIGDTTMTLIGYESFKGSLFSFVSIPKSITEIQNFAFAESNLQGITFTDDSELSVIASYAFKKSNLKEITIPANVTMIQGNAFAGSQNLTNVTFEEGSKLNFIGAVAFQNTNISTINIPSSVSSITAGAFYDMPNLTTIYKCSDITIPLNSYEDDVTISEINCEG